MPQPSDDTITTAIIMSAGFGTRMRSLTLETPKPLVKFMGKALIDHILDKLVAAEFTKSIVNVHYLAAQIYEHLKGRINPEIIISDETEQILDTGGGIVNALPLLGENTFLVINSDSNWVEGETPAIKAMCEFWDSELMDCLVLLSPLGRNIGYNGSGDFDIDSYSRITRKKMGQKASYANMGVYLLNPRVFSNIKEKKFSMNLIWDQLIAKERLFGFIHNELWLHIGTEAALREAELVMAKLTD